MTQAQQKTLVQAADPFSRVERGDGGFRHMTVHRGTKYSQWVSAKVISSLALLGLVWVNEDGRVIPTSQGWRRVEQYYLESKG